ncbi:hypothetical protein [Agromyces sp. ZXT2-6]|uniref:hypothetical protein n=1 Tax=Agromyces sp. ZXT2-6 TaxID=3461153 RepID=UPI0040550E4E
MVDFAQQLYGADSSVRLAEAVQARVKDPLWFLARQWQVGEFTAENGGRPAWVSAAWSEFALATLNRSGTDEQIDLDAPLEWAVEREEPNGESPAWQSAALEHSFELDTGAHRLRAGEYVGPTVDWYAVDLVATSPADPTDTGTRRVVPTQIAVPGAPHPRWWRLEDADAYLDSPNDPEPNVLSMLLPELGYVDVNDWYIVPLEQRGGTLRRITELSVVDSFGVLTPIPPVDAESWTVFTLTTADGQDPAAAQDLLFVPNNAVAIVSNDDVEDVRFLPDEHANLVWAFEQAYRTEDGQLVTNGEASVRQGAGPQDDADLPRYRFAAGASPAWVPYLPRTRPGPGGAVAELYLRRGRTDPQANAGNPQYHSRIVAEAWRLNEHEVPPDGIRVRRTHRYARGSDGRAYFWVGRRAEPSPRATFPRTAFDYLEGDDSG